jgi:hypothetical protein
MAIRTERTVLNDDCPATENPAILKVRTGSNIPAACHDYELSAQAVWFLPMPALAVCKDS